MNYQDRILLLSELLSCQPKELIIESRLLARSNDARYNFRRQLNADLLALGRNGLAEYQNLVVKVAAVGSERIRIRLEPSLVGLVDSTTNKETDNGPASGSISNSLGETQGEWDNQGGHSGGSLQ